MPAFRSFFTLSVLAACLAQVMADGYGPGGGSYGGGGPGGPAGAAGSGGPGGKGGWGGDKGGMGASQWGEWSSAPETSAWPVEAPTTNVAAQNCPPPVTMTETTTVTAVSPCTASPVTAYVTQYVNAPPGCWCGAGGPPADWGMGGGSWGDAAVFTSTNAAFTPGLSSIPASEAVKTGVTVAAAAAAPPPTAAVSPGGFFDSSSSTATASGTETSGPSSVPSNKAQQPTKAGEAPKPEAASPTSSSSSSSSSSSESTNSTTAPTTSTSTPATISSSTSSSESPQADSVTEGGSPPGAFRTLDPATLSLKNAYTLGIGKRAPLPTLLSPS